MNKIILETAKFTADKGFQYAEWQSFPSTAKGLNFAVVAAACMMAVEPYQMPHSDIRLSFQEDGRTSHLDDAQFVALIDRMRSGASIFEKCQKTMAEIMLAAAQRENKLGIARAAVEDLMDVQVRITAGKVERSNDPDEIMAEIAAANLDITLTLFNRRGVNIGEIVFEDGKNHEIFKRRPSTLDYTLDRAFGLINECNDYGCIQSL